MGSGDVVAYAYTNLRPPASLNCKVHDRITYMNNVARGVFRSTNKYAPQAETSIRLDVILSSPKVLNVLGAWCIWIALILVR